MTVGWHWEFGGELTDGIELYYEHHSRHVMDSEQPYFYDVDSNTLYRHRFPVEDSIGIRFTIVDRQK